MAIWISCFHTDAHEEKNVGADGAAGLRAAFGLSEAGFKTPVFLSCSQPDLILLLLGVALTLLLEICIGMTADRVFMTLSKKVIGLVIKMLFSSESRSPLQPCLYLFQYLVLFKLQVSLFT